METDIIGSSAAAEKTERRSTLDATGLGRDAFLKIFLTQLENQDPLSPQDTAQLSAQLAQFSQLEQSLQIAEELQGVNARLDRMLELSGGGSSTTAALQPISLLGREVEVSGSRLRLPDVGTSLPLRFDLPAAASLLQIEAESLAGQPLARFQLRAATDESGELVPLSAGGYELTFRDGEPQLRLPGGGSLPVEMVRLERRGEELVPALDEAGATVPFAFAPGTLYAFSVGGSSVERQPLEVSTTTSGRVEAIRNAPEGPTLSVNGEEIGLSQVIRIR